MLEIFHHQLTFFFRFYRSDESDVEDSDDNESDDVNIDAGLGLSESDSEIAEGPGEKQRNPLLTDLDQRERKEKRMGKVALWFEKDAFKNLETEVDEDYELDEVTEFVKKRGGRVRGEVKPEVKAEESSEGDSDDSDDEEEGENKAEDPGFEVVPKGGGKNNKKRKLNEEGLAMGTLMVSSKKKKRDMIDDAWNRYEIFFSALGVFMFVLGTLLMMKIFRTGLSKTKESI